MKNDMAVKQQINGILFLQDLAIYFRIKNCICIDKSITI